MGDHVFFYTIHEHVRSSFHNKIRTFLAVNMDAGIVKKRKMDVNENGDKVGQDLFAKKDRVSCFPEISEVILCAELNTGGFASQSMHTRTQNCTTHHFMKNNII